MEKITSLIDKCRDLIPRFLSFLPQKVTSFIQSHLLFSLILWAFAIFTFSFFYSPVFIQVENDAYLAQEFEWWPDLSKTITHFWLLSEKKLREFLSIPEPKNIIIPEKKIKPSGNNRGISFGNSDMPLIGAWSSLGDIGTYSKYYVFSKILSYILILICAYFITSRWSLLLSLLSFVGISVSYFIKRMFPQDEIQNFLELKYQDNHNFFVPHLYSERIIEFATLLLIVVSIYYFIHSFKKKNNPELLH
jgi:hypothetical protein